LIKTALIKTDTTVRTLYSGVGDRTTVLQTLSQYYCSLIRNTWYSTSPDRTLSPTDEIQVKYKCVGLVTK